MSGSFMYDVMCLGEYGMSTLFLYDAMRLGERLIC